jgi:hypothetical protein
MLGLRLRARVSARYYLALPHFVSVAENRIVRGLGGLVLRIEGSYYPAYCFRIISYTNKKSVQMQDTIFNRFMVVLWDGIIHLKFST